MKTIKLDIIHFHRIEYYPPVINLINILKNTKTIDYCIYTTNNKFKSLTLKNSKQTRRIININQNNITILRWVKYVYFNIATVIYIFLRKPDCILYYETLSSLPAIIYKKYINKNVKIIVHYHEITVEDELNQESKLVQLLRPIEKKLYSQFSWISQTNKTRTDFFAKNYASYILTQEVKVLPNYPPRSWYTPKKSQKRLQDRHKTILVGSVSSKTMYLKEYCQWIINQEGRFTFDIFTFHIDKSTSEYITSLNSPYINIHKPVPYLQLNQLLNGYDIGVILYKAIDTNTKFCASNKLFEYHTCNLDVWFPKEQIGSLEYIKKNTYPKIIDIDYSNLEKIDSNELVNRNQLTYSNLQFNCEAIYENFIEQIKKFSI